MVKSVTCVADDHVVTSLGSTTNGAGFISDGVSIPGISQVMQAGAAPGTWTSHFGI
jgi:hypothetical protein